MKKLLIIAIAFVSVQSIAFAQGPRNNDRDGKMHFMKDLSPEEVATLKTKKMTLHLDLNKSQQKDIYEINLEDAKMMKEKMEEREAKRKSGEREKPSKEDMFKRMNERLDHQIAMKAKMKDILNDDQYAKWEKLQAEKGKNMKGQRNKDNKDKKGPKK